MADPGRYYREVGGEAFLARPDGKVVGAVAVKQIGASGFEFCKLMVTEAARGHGLGRLLVERCVNFAAGRVRPALYLQTFKVLHISLSVYRKMGFVDAPAPPEMPVLARTEVIMATPVATDRR